MYTCKFYVRGKFKLSCNSENYEKNYKMLCDKYGCENISIEKILVGRRFNSKLNTIISKIREFAD
ncbi:Uncharacterised protein [uncultured Clostridium sp.]|nr:Uncharacterised protein [uncultured Clostridium sp.]